MPAEWAPHQATLMAWPTITRRGFWGDLFDRAKSDWASMANAVAAFEPVVMVADPEQAAEARSMCAEGVEILPIPIDDSWMRDNGPVFVTDGAGAVALVHFRFNSWGNKYLPFDRDAEVPKHIASHLGMRRYEAPMVLEGGSFFVDGEGTLVTTEQCLLHENRNPDMTREEIERTLGDYLGVEHVIWLGRGHPLDRDTDGHVDAIAQYVATGEDPARRPRRSRRPVPRRGSGQPGSAPCGTRCRRPADRRRGVRRRNAIGHRVHEPLPGERWRDRSRRRGAERRDRPRTAATRLPRSRGRHGARRRSSSRAAGVPIASRSRCRSAPPWRRAGRDRLRVR